MDIKIKPYKKSHYPMIASWWTSSGEIGPLEGSMVEDGSFILYLNGVAALSLTVLLTQSKEIAYLENFIANPEVKSPARQECSHILGMHCLEYAKRRGYKRLIALAHRDKLKDHYQKLGMRKSLSNLDGFVKET